MYDAIFFDLDGTLVDTETIAAATGILAFAAHGHAVDEAFMHSLIGKDEPTAARIIRAALPGADLESLKPLEGGFDAGVAQGLPLKRGAADPFGDAGFAGGFWSPRPGRGGASQAGDRRDCRCLRRMW